MVGSRYCSKECKAAGSTLPRIAAECPTCREVFATYVAKAGEQVRTFCSHRCATAYRVTTDVGRKVNGRAVTTHVSGYLMVWVPNRGRIMEHRYVMERSLGRELLPDEQVHHVNHVKTDNRLENLALLSPSAHARVTRDETGMRAQAKARRILELEAELLLLRQQVGSK